jgi:hypothetical protein
MLCKRLPTILPPLTMADSLETTRIYSSAGRLLEQHAALDSAGEADIKPDHLAEAIQYCRLDRRL